jgi:hypothetical protein
MYGDCVMVTMPEGLKAKIDFPVSKDPVKDNSVI